MLRRLGAVCWMLWVLSGGTACRSKATHGAPDGAGPQHRVTPPAAPRAAASSTGTPLPSGSAPYASGAAPAVNALASANANAKPQPKAALHPDAQSDPWPLRMAEVGRGRRAEAGGSLKGSIKSLLCEGRSPCRVLEVQDAGTAPDGLSLEVMKLSLAAKSRPEMDPARLNEPCEPIEYWLVTRDGTQLQSTELLLELCNDGYGAAAIGEDTIEIANNRFSHIQAGGTAWRWATTRVLQLAPRRYLELQNVGYRSADANRNQLIWNWDAFSGMEYHFAPECDAQGAPPENPAEGDRGQTWTEIPVVEADAEFMSDGWRTTALGGCAAQVMTEGPALADGASGFVVHGNHGGSEDSHFRVVGLSDGSFVLEIHDDRLVTHAKRALFEDHVEIWSTDAAALNYSNNCEEKRKERPVQWGVRLADGGVFSGSGAPPKEEVRVELGERTAHVVHLKVRVARPGSLITFVYSDSDDGEKQKSLIATSDLVFGRSVSLGQTLKIDPKDATCRVRSGRLEPVLK